MMKHAAALAIVVCSLAAGSAAASNLSASQNSQNYSNDEQTLCQPDVFRLCNDYVPDEDRIIACMKANRRALSADCRKVFDAGLKKSGR